jgi:hypothetical protein
VFVCPAIQRTDAFEIAARAEAEGFAPSRAHGGVLEKPFFEFRAFAAALFDDEEEGGEEEKKDDEDDDELFDRDC